MTPKYFAVSFLNLSIIQASLSNFTLQPKSIKYN